MSIISHFFEWLTKPSEERTDFRKYRGRLLAWMQLVLIFLCIATILYQLFSQSVDPQNRAPYVSLMSLILALLVVSTYLDFKGKYYYSARILVLCGLIGPWGSLILDPSIKQGNFVPLMYNSISIFFSGLFLRAVDTGVLAILQIVGLHLYLSWFTVDTPINYASFMFFFVYVSFISVIFNLLSQKDEAIIVDQFDQLEESREQLREQSIRDPLTGLYNRRYLEETLDREFYRVERNQEPLSIVIFDVDNFKEINDQYGHLAGDTIIIHISEILQNNFRRSEIVCRYGGDEFLVVLPGANVDQTYLRFEKIREMVAGFSTPNEEGTSEQVTISAGIAAYPRSGLEPARVIEAADHALYHAKASGRNRIVVAEGRHYESTKLDRAP